MSDYITLEGNGRMCGYLFMVIRAINSDRNEFSLNPAHSPL